MIASLKRYTRFFLVTFFARKERKHLVRDFADWFFRKRFLTASYTPEEKEKALADAIDWLCRAQDRMQDKGFGTYFITEGWSTSYPETSGYIIPSLLTYKTDAALRQRCIDAGEWLMQIQKPSGGWQSLYMANNRPEVVFNTGQVLRGLVALYELTGDRRYLDSCIRACDWLCAIQEEDGSWMKHAFMNKKRVYDSYVDHPLLQVWKHTGKDQYKQAALKNLYWIIEKKQHESGWFEDCDNTIKHNDRPILHTLSYTIDGLIQSGLLLDDQQLIAAGEKAALQLLEIFQRNGWLHGRWDRHWQGSEYMICTGCAQISIVWLTLYRITGKEIYREAASAINNQLVFIQQRSEKNDADGKGALPGSFPLWGKYEPFAYPNWATKYLADALMMELALTK